MLRFIEPALQLLRQHGDDVDLVIACRLEVKLVGIDGRLLRRVTDHDFVLVEVFADSFLT